MSHRSHPLARAKSRYGLNLTHRDLGRLAWRLKKGKGTLLRAQSYAIGEYIIERGGVWLRVVYHRKRNRILTFLEWQEEPMAQQIQVGAWTVELNEDANGDLAVKFKHSDRSEVRFYENFAAMGIELLLSTAKLEEAQNAQAANEEAQDERNGL